MEIDVLEGMLAKPMDCKACGAKMRRMISAGLPPVFVGGGFFVNDYPKVKT